MAPLEPLAGMPEPPPSSAVETHPRLRSLSISSYTAQTHLSNSITSLRSAGVAPTTLTTTTTPKTGIHALTARLGLRGVARRTLGIGLLLLTVFLWTLSNFLASYIFSDHTYNKPFFVVYVNTSMFAISLVPMLVRFVARERLEGVRREARALLRWDGSTTGAAPSAGTKERAARIPDEEHDGLLARSEYEDDLLEAGEGGSNSPFELDDTPELAGGACGADEKLSLRATAMLSLEFCMLWFCANYFASACLEYTSVGSVTILSSTSSVWTLVFCAVMRVDTFTVRKLLGVLASLAGVVLISTVDLSGASDEDRGTFPHKSQTSIAIGDGMAFFSAIVYGLYVTVMKRRVGDEDRVDMQLFFGLVGLFNLVLLWPGFFILHWTQIEPFGWPPSGQVWAIILVNSMSSFISDMSWAYAMLLTTPLVVTVGLSLSIPLSLIGEMIQYGQYSSWIYWAGAGVVLSSFLFINHESKEGEEEDEM